MNIHHCTYLDMFLCKCFDNYKNMHHHILLYILHNKYLYTY